MSIFGAIKLSDDLETATVNTLGSWWPVYSREVELQAQITPGSIAPPKSWLKANQLDREAADALPSIVVVSPGLSGRNAPKQEGDGSFRCWFSIAVGVFVASEDRKSTMRLVRLYTAIARTIILQKQSLRGFADGTTWLDESYDDNFPFADGRTISAGQVVFEVEVAGVVNRFDGPSTGSVEFPATPDPINQPGSNWPLVEIVTSTVDVRED